MVYRQERLDATFSALSDPTRRAILGMLMRGERTIGQLASRFEMSLPAVSKHVRVLERAGLTRVRREGRVRRCTLQPTPMREAADWIARYERYWEAGLDRLEAYLEEQEREENERWQKSEPEPDNASASPVHSQRRASASSGRGRKRKR
jgi:DNA-binding transcriptional ArsR family regulator